MNDRITLLDTPKDMVWKLCEGNPGAMNVCLPLLSKGAEIDPDAFMGGLGSLLSLDTHRIYGPRIWMLYKDVCDQDLVSAAGLLRAVQLGFVTESALNHAIDHYGEGVDLKGALAQVRNRLPAFAQD